MGVKVCPRLTVYRLETKNGYPHKQNDIHPLYPVEAGDLKFGVSAVGRLIVRLSTLILTHAGKGG